jgi:6-phosphogluconolactonase
MTPGTKSQAQSSLETVYIGTYSEPGEPGLFVYEFNRNEGSLKIVQEVAGMESPSYLEINPNGKFLYSANRSSVIPDKPWGSISAFKIDQLTGRINHINDQPSFGSESCHVSIDSQGRLLFVANYTTGNVCVYPINSDGSLGTISSSVQHTGSSINKSRQEGPHAHCTTVSPDNNFLYVTDLGIDRIKANKIDYEKNILIPISESDGLVEKGSGPRHFTIHPNEKFAYVIEELSSSITFFDYNKEDGSLTVKQSIKTIPVEFNDINYCADIHISPSGKYLYGSNRGHNSLAIFSIDQDNGMLSIVDYQPTFGEWPRNFLIDPDGDFIFVANQNSDNLVIFKVNTQSGKLTKTGEVTDIQNPVCIKLLKL